MEKLNEVISSNLVFLRKKYNFKQSDIAEKLNYSYKTISKWETGEIIPNVENLMQLADLFNVSLDEITKPLDKAKFMKTKRTLIDRNKLIITLLSISVVWIFATVIFAYSNIIFKKSFWQIFVWAVPISCIIGIIFNSLWGSKKINYVIISVLVWSTITCFYLQFIQFNLLPLYFIGIPAQIAILLWSGLKSSKSSKKEIDEL